MKESTRQYGIPLPGWVKESLFHKRMNSWQGWIIMALVGIGLGFVGSQLGYKAPLMVAGASAGILFVLACMQFPAFSYYVFLTSIVLFTIPGRLFGINLPLGAVLEGCGYLTVVSILSAEYKKRTDTREFWKAPLSIMVLLSFVYIFLEAFNPEIDSRVGWFNIFRKQILYVLFYYVSYCMFDSLKEINRFVKIWIIMATVVAIWGIKQQYLGFTKYEDAWIHSDPIIASLLFQGGMFRKFSLLTDPASFGVMSVSSGLFTLVLAIREKNKKTRNLLYLSSILQIVSSSYSGTRTSNAMVVGGLLSYIVFTINEKKSLTVLAISVFMGVFLLFGPFKNSPVISRVRTTFEANKDASKLLRDVNRKNIQPYIHSHPMGGGMQTSGEEGLRFYPTHKLAGYPPDSGYMKVLLEQGWIGFLITIIFYFLILQKGVAGFYDSRKPEIKNLYIAFTVCFFSLTVGQYSQLAIGPYPQYLFFLASLVIFYKLKEYDSIPPEDEGHYLA